MLNSDFTSAFDIQHSALCSSFADRHREVGRRAAAEDSQRHAASDAVGVEQREQVVDGSNCLLIEVVGETRTLAEARKLTGIADAWLIAAEAREEEEVQGREHLTPRELEVLELLAQGLPNKAIAARLGISDQTVKFHVAAICGKLGAANRTDAARRALRLGVISL